MLDKLENLVVSHLGNEPSRDGDYEKSHLHQAQHSAEEGSQGSRRIVLSHDDEVGVLDSETLPESLESSSVGSADAVLDEEDGSFNDWDTVVCCFSFYIDRLYLFNVDLSIDNVCLGIIYLIDEWLLLVGLIVCTMRLL